MEGWFLIASNFPICFSIHIYLFFKYITFLKSLFFFTVDHFYGLLQYCSCFVFWFFGHKAYGILAPQPGIEPAPPTLEGEFSTTGPQGTSQYVTYVLLKKCLILKSKSYENQQNVECWMTTIATRSTTVQWMNDLLN